MARLRKPSPPRAYWLLQAVVLAMAFPTLAAADWREAFAAGVMARDQRRWEDVVRFMQQAIDQNPRATGEKVRVYGMKFERYLPHYYLGIGYYHLNDCFKALDAFAKARAAGTLWLLARTHMQTLEEHCQKKGILPPLPPPPTSVPDPLSLAPLPTTPAMAPDDVRREILTQRIGEAREILRPAEELAAKIERWLDATNFAIFRRQPTLEARYLAVGSKLLGARALLDAIEREGDLEAVQKVPEATKGVLAELEVLAWEMGAR